MADALYNDIRNAFLGNPTHSVPDLDTDDIRVVLLDEGSDALNLADVDLADIATGAARVATSGQLSSTTVGTVADGTFDHADETISTVSGNTVESLIYYKHTGTESTSPLIFNIDSWTGLPLTPNGGDVTLQPHSNGVFQLTGS